MTSLIFISTNYLTHIIYTAVSKYMATQDSQGEPSWTKNHLASANLNHSYTMWMTSFSWGRWEMTEDGAVWSMAPAMRKRRGKVPVCNWCCSSQPPFSVCVRQNSERMVQQLLLPGACRKGKVEGSSCLSSSNQVQLLEKAVLQRGLLSQGREDEWVGDMMLLMVG